MQKFKTGQKVVCVQTSVQNHINVIKGEIYTVEGYSPLNGIGVLIVEAPDKDLRGFWEHLFREIDDSWVDELLNEIIKKPDFVECVLS